MALVLSFLLWLAARHLAWFKANFSQNFQLGLAVLVCYVLYLIRQNFRLTYSTLEFAAGMAAIIGAIGGARAVIPDEPEGERYLVQLLAGIYVVIRSFDNLAQSRLFEGNERARSFRELFEGRWGRKRKE